MVTEGANTKVRSYEGGFEYKNGVLSVIHTDEGFVDYTTTGFVYNYFLKDHLGNTRAVFSPGTGGTLTLNQSTDYYPFGLDHAPGYGAGYSKYKYNGKEIQDDLIGSVALDWYDYGARMYDPQIGRWHVVDPLAEDYYSQSLYHFSGNNPINFIDLNGMEYNPIYDLNGEFLGTDNRGLQGDAIMMNKKDFTQGMSHSAALGKGVTASTFAAVVSSVPLLSSLSTALQPTFEKIKSHASNLCSRPDYDGFVTIGEGIAWAKQRPNSLNNNRPNDALYLDASKMNFGNLSVSDMTSLGFSDGTKGSINLFNYVSWTSGSSWSTAYALGNTQLQLVNSQKGTVKLFNDIYDWDFHNYPQSLNDAGKLPKNTRDKLIYYERQRTGLNDSHGFRVFMYGLGTIKTK